MLELADAAASFCSFEKHADTVRFDELMAKARIPDARGCRNGVCLLPLMMRSPAAAAPTPGASGHLVLCKERGNCL